MFNQWNEFTQWLSRNGCFIRDASCPETHLLLNGGRLHVSRALHRDFMHEYTRAIWRDSLNLYVVEKKTETFRMAAELDLCVQGPALPNDLIMDAIVRGVFCAVTDRLYPSTRPRILVSTTPPTEPEPGKTKHGIHLAWPELVVTLDTARVLRAHILDYLTKWAPEQVRNIKLVENWITVFDTAIFVKNGLRLLWSRKARKCPDCGGVLREVLREERKRRKAQNVFGDDVIVQRPYVKPCYTCNNDGLIDEGRVYELEAIVSTRGGTVDSEEFEALKYDHERRLELCSMRTWEEPTRQSDMFVPEIVSAIPAEYATRSRGRKAKGKAFAEKRPRTAGSTEMVALCADDPAYPVIREFVSAKLSSVVIRIMTGKDKHWYLANTSSRMCRNKGAEHHSSTVYYMLYPDGAVQRCWCQKPDKWKSWGVPCREYSSALIEYDEEWARRMHSLFSQRYVRIMSPAAPKKRGRSKIGTRCDDSLDSLLSGDVELMSATSFEEQIRISEERKRSIVS